MCQARDMAMTEIQKVLRLIDVNDGITPETIAETVGLTLTTVHLVVNKLEDMNMVWEDDELYHVTLIGDELLATRAAALEAGAEA